MFNEFLYFILIISRDKFETKHGTNPPIFFVLFIKFWRKTIPKAYNPNCYNFVVHIFHLEFKFRASLFKKNKQ